MNNKWTKWLVGLAGVALFSGFVGFISNEGDAAAGQRGYSNVRDGNDDGQGSAIDQWNEQNGGGFDDGSSSDGRIDGGGSAQSPFRSGGRMRTRAS